MQRILGSQSPILITGLRDGEKLNEILVEEDSRCEQSLHPDIRTLSLNMKSVPNLVSILNAVESRDESAILDLLA
jgi:FlaA1/EpsC-like NDP-sugar epimerase